MVGAPTVSLPVHLTVGEATAEIGALVLDAVPGGEHLVAISTELARFLYAVADALHDAAANEQQEVPHGRR